MPGGVIVIFILFAGLVVALGVYGAIATRKRREALAQLAPRLGLIYSAEKDSQRATRYRFLNRLNQGSNRYAYNVLSGTHQGETVEVFDYHYETHSTDSKGRRQTQHHHFSFFILQLPGDFPELTIGPEGVLSKLAQTLGFDDIDFDSHEFSRRFCVRSKNKKFAYDVCHTGMMEYLLANPDLAIEIEGAALALGFSRRLSVPDIEPNLGRLVQLRRLLPDYLFPAPRHA